MGKSLLDNITVEVVDNRARIRHFIALPQELNSSDPNWITPLNFEIRHRISSKNPFFEHARVCLWVAYREGRPVGRISAQVDELYLKTHGTNTPFTDQMLDFDGLNALLGTNEMLALGAGYDADNFEDSND